MHVDAQGRSARKIARETPPSECPVHADDAGVWHVQSYPAARAVLRSTATRQAGFGADQAVRMLNRMRPPVLYRDGVEHREHRRQTAKYFTPRKVNDSYRELMHRFADEQIAKLRRKGRAEIGRAHV